MSSRSWLATAFDLMSWDLKSNEIDELDFYERQRFRVVIVTEIVHEASIELILLVRCFQCQLERSLFVLCLGWRGKERCVHCQLMRYVDDKSRLVRSKFRVQLGRGDQSQNMCFNVSV